MDFKYAVIPMEKAKELELEQIRQKTKDGDVLVNQTDLSVVGQTEDDFESKVKQLGGYVITAKEALQQLNK
ncbi:MAG: hypothetical protein RR202_10610 [Bacteroidales bacterium]